MNTDKIQCQCAIVYTAKKQLFFGWGGNVLQNQLTNETNIYSDSCFIFSCYRNPQLLVDESY